MKRATLGFLRTWGCCSFLKQGRIIAPLSTPQDCSAARFSVAHLVSVPEGNSLI